MQRRCFLLSILLCTSNAYAAFEQSGLAPRAVALGGAYTALADEPEGIFWNPGGIAALRTTTCWSAYSRPFGLRELASTAAVLVTPAFPGTWAFGVRTFGSSLYRETTALVSVAGALTSGVRVGATLRALRVDLQDFGSANGFAFDLGFVGRVGSRVDWGVCLWNAGNARMAGEALSQSLSSGWAFRPTSDAALVVDVCKVLTAPLQTRVGLEYTPVDGLSLRVGVHDRPASLGAGAGWSVGRWRIDYGAYTHLILGWSHQVAVHLPIGAGERERGGQRQICP